MDLEADKEWNIWTGQCIQGHVAIGITEIHTHTHTHDWWSLWRTRPRSLTSPVTLHRHDDDEQAELNDRQTLLLLSLCVSVSFQQMVTLKANCSNLLYRVISGRHRGALHPNQLQCSS